MHMWPTQHGGVGGGCGAASVIPEVRVPADQAFTIEVWSQ